MNGGDSSRETPWGPRNLSISALALGAALVAAVAAPTFTGGGFEPSSRSLFVVFAGVALLAAGTTARQEAARAARSPLAIALLALALVSVLSAAWTIAGQSAAVRWGLVIAGYAAVLIAADSLAAQTGPWPVATGIAVLAIAEGLIGLAAVAYHALPDAERLVRAWEPGGTYQYPPALALLEVSALPVLLQLLKHRHPTLSGAAASALVLAGATLRLSDSRLAFGLAALLFAALLLTVRSDRVDRTATLFGSAFAIAGGLIAPLILGSAVGPTTHGADGRGLAEIITVALAGGIGWPAARSCLAARRPNGPAVTSLAAAAALATLALTTATTPINHTPPRPLHAVERPVQHADVFHGRTHEWLAAIQTWLDRPILGAGADAYYLASMPHQTLDRSRYAHNLPLELAAELGIPGLLLALAIYVSTGSALYKGRARQAARLLGPLALVFLISNLVDWTWHLAGLAAIWAVAAGAVQAPAVPGGPQGRRP